VINTKVGWCLYGNEALVAYEAPAPLLPPKDLSVKGNGFLSCPAVRSFTAGIFIVHSPFSIKLRFTKGKDSFSVRPVYPFTSIAEELIPELVSIEPPSSWRSKRFLVFQIPSPYVFFSDEKLFLEQSHPLLTDQSAFNWRVVPGKFDIYAWQRPLNWAVEWDTDLGDFEIRVGEPQYILRFYSLTDAPVQKISLIKQNLSTEINERIKLTTGITKIRKGVSPLFEKSSQLRSGIKFIKDSDE